MVCGGEKLREKWDQSSVQSASSITPRAERRVQTILCDGRRDWYEGVVEPEHELSGRVLASFIRRD